MVLHNVIEHLFHLLAGFVTALHKNISVKRPRGDIRSHLDIGSSGPPLEVLDGVSSPSDDQTYTVLRDLDH